MFKLVQNSQNIGILQYTQLPSKVFKDVSLFHLRGVAICSTIEFINEHKMIINNNQASIQTFQPEKLTYPTLTV